MMTTDSADLDSLIDGTPCLVPRQGLIWYTSYWSIPQKYATLLVIMMSMYVNRVTCRIIVSCVDSRYIREDAW